ncbi:MAG: hypothetical protein Q7N50_16170 [Armatimonadota bacterium]|nr:hypothetical protein [Armatimonadota bacterium]
MLKKTILLALTLCFIAIAALPAGAQSFMYSNSRRQINAGVLIDPRGGGFNPGSKAMVFYILDQAVGLKPRGWEFTNPLSSYSSGVRQSANYWLVNLATTMPDNLNKFDILYLSAPGEISLLPEDREKLRRFVDGGGLLWVDQDINDMAFDPIDPMKRLFITGFNFTPGPPSPGARQLPMIAARHHPLLTSPYWLGDFEIRTLGYDNITNCYLKLGEIASDGTPLESTTLSAIVRNPAVNDPAQKFAYVAGTHYGSGLVVATAGDIGSDILSVWSGGIDPNSLKIYANDIKLAYNIINWAAAWPAFRKNPRRTGASLENLGAPMIERWMYPGPSFTGELETSPVLYKNVFFFTDGANIYAFDGQPREDLDGDYNPDDGFQDGDVSYDLIWTTKDSESAIPVSCSSPIVTELRVNGECVDAVIVQGEDHKIYVWKAFPSDPSTGQLLGTPQNITGSLLPMLDPGGVGDKAGKSHPVAFHDGWIYQAGTDGVMRGYNPSRPGDPSWFVPNLTQPNDDAEYHTAPVVGSVKNSESGAEVDMIYAVVEPDPLGSGNPNDRIYAIPIAVRNDRLRWSGGVNYVSSIYPNRPVVVVTDNSPSPKIISPEIWAKDAAGTPRSVKWNPDDAAAAALVAQGAFPIVQSNGNAVEKGWTVYANYRLKHPTTDTELYTPVDRYAIPPNLPTLGIPTLEVSGAPALGGNGLIFLCGNRESSIGDVQCIQQSFRGASGSTDWTLKWHYPLHAGFDWEGVPVPGVAMDHTFDTSPGLPGVAIPGLQPSGSPVFVGDKLLVTASATGGEAPGSRSGGVLLCFKANPDFVIRVHEPLINPTTRSRRDVRLYQPDPLSPTATQPLPVSCPSVPQDMIDYRRGTITIKDFNKFLIPSPPGATPIPLSPISPAVPVKVYVDSIELPKEQVDLSQWNNLLWYMPLYHGAYNQPCSGVHSSPIVVGNMVYFQCDDTWEPPGGGAARPFVFAVDIETGVTNGSQVYCVPPAYDPTNRELASHVKWIYHLADKSSTVDTIYSSMAAANGLMATIGPGGFMGFDNPLTLIADNRRLVEVDGGGSSAWSLEAMQKALALNTSTLCESYEALSLSKGKLPLYPERQTFNRPSVARFMDTGDLLVVDTGNNQVVVMDRLANAKWWVNRFQDADGLIRPGDPLQLNGPTDAYVWEQREQGADGNYYDVRHHLIADGGNFRILDIVDKYPPNHVTNDIITCQSVNWVSNTLAQGKRYEFRNVQHWVDPYEPSKQYILAGISNYSASDTAVGLQQPGGTVALLDYRTIDKDTLAVTMGDGSMLQKIIVNGVTYDGYYTHFTGLDPTPTLPIPLTGLRFVSRFYTGDTADPWHDLICISTGVYEIDSKAFLFKKWLTSGEYSDMMRSVDAIGASPTAGVIAAPLLATSARILGKNQMLITNGYAGYSDKSNWSGTSGSAGFVGGEFSGEVFEIERATGSKPIMKWYAPRIKVTKQVDANTWAVRQYTPNGSNLEQPSCADRPPR